MTRLAWWHCFAGIAGDMALGALIDAGADLALIERELAGLPIGGWSLDALPVLKGGLACTGLVVHAEDTSVVRTHAHIVGLITEARLPERARRRALDTFARLAEVEGRLHRRPPAQVHFHEVGGIDAIIDIVGTCVALEILGVDRVASSAVAQGTGVVRTAHGLLPNPSPAVVGLLADTGAPTYGTDRPVELTTPTGAALLATLVDRWGPLPAMTVETSGFGAGTRDLDGMPNAVQVVIGAVAEAGVDPAQGQPIQLLETNVDDVTGEVLAHTVSRLLAAGAHDAWITPIIAKKGRPAHMISVVCDHTVALELRTILASETGTLGVRAQDLHRWVASRDVSEVVVDGHPIRVKQGPNRSKAEHDDVVRVARRMGLPARQVARRAEDEADRLR
ncbi:MAG: nickel pincer cofactor biosynthesis protein LarC [Actinomycetota bacterium]|nr:nickel pincer cofactor biosynthesis protein LarC [Actinomycetota bacterium]